MTSFYCPHLIAPVLTLVLCHGSLFSPSALDAASGSSYHIKAVVYRDLDQSLRLSQPLKEGLCGIIRGVLQLVYSHLRVSLNQIIQDWISRLSSVL